MEVALRRDHVVPHQPQAVRGHRSTPSRRSPSARPTCTSRSSSPRASPLWATMVLAAGRPEEMAEAASRAALQVSRAGRHIGQEAIQLHGGIGMTAEYSIGSYTSRLTALDHLLGDGDHHLRLLAATVGDHEEVDPCLPAVTLGQAALEEHDDLVVRRSAGTCRAPARAGGAQRRHGGQVAGQGLRVAAGVDDVPHVGGLQPAAQLRPDAAPRRVDDDQVGRAGRASANAVASPAANRTPPRPGSRARSAVALAIASTLVSMPMTVAARARRTCSANPPTPQYRSHTDAGASSSTQSRPRAGTARRPPRCSSGRSSAGAGAGRSR